MTDTAITVDDWLATVGDNLKEILKDNQTFSKGVRVELDDMLVSVMITHQVNGGYDGYLFAESDEIDNAVAALETIQAVLAVDKHTDKTVAVSKDETWAESHFTVDPDRIRTL